MIISKTPLRISFAGGGTDLAAYYKNQGGMVISSTIDKYIYVIVKERFDESIVLHYTDNEIVDSVDGIKHGLIRESLRLVGIRNGIELITLADIPSKGTGLGSSSSLTVGLLNALYTYRGIQVSTARLASEACKIEIDILGKPIGKQDQFIAAFGGLRRFDFLKDGNVTQKEFLISSQDRRILGANLIMHYTNIMRDADAILKEQSTNIDSNKMELDNIAAMVPVLERSIISREFGILGDILRAGWLEKRRVAANITNPGIDSMVEAAMAHGATGCKIAGAGGGGFLLSYVPREQQNEYRNAMRLYRELPFMLDAFGSKIIFNIQFDTNSRFVNEPT